MWSTGQSLPSWGTGPSESMAEGPIENETMVASENAQTEQDKNILTSKSIDTNDNGTTGEWMCQPYKIELLERQLFNNSPGMSRRTAVIETLREVGVKVYVIDAASTESTEEVIQHVRRVVAFVAQENHFAKRTGPLGFQRCLLYQDEQGRLFNLMLSRYSVGPISTYLDYLETFSGREAMIAITVLCRSLSCVTTHDTIETLRPAYLALILGLVLNEEMSLSWLNASMMIRGTPSVSAHALTAPFGSDNLRKLTLFALTLAGATSGKLQSLLTYGGVAMACIILLANLGARSWLFLRWRPLGYNGPGSYLLAYLLAILYGVLLPYMGHRSITMGGKAAMEYVLTTAMVVAVVFVISDFDEIQRFLVVGSDLCDQDTVNLFVGVWWTVTLIGALVLVRNIPTRVQKPENGERLLLQDHSSPVGYKIPSLPDFEIDASLANTGSPCLSLNVEFIIGIIMALAVGTWLVSLSFTMWEDDLYRDISNVL